MEQEREDADVEAAPEGAADEARPDTEDTEGNGSTITDPDPEQQDPESGPAAG